MKNLTTLLLITFSLFACKKEELFPLLNEGGTATDTSMASVPCNSGILINGCFAQDSLNFNFPNVINFDKFQFKHKKRDFIRLKNGAGMQTFLLASEQTFPADTYYVEVKVPKSGLTFAMDFAFDVGDSLNPAYFPIFGYPFSAQIDTSSNVQYMTYTFIIEPVYGGLEPHFILVGSGNYGAGLISKIEYISITN